MDRNMLIHVYVCVCELLFGVMNLKGHVLLLILCLFPATGELFSQASLSPN